MVELVTEDLFDFDGFIIFDALAAVYAFQLVRVSDPCCISLHESEVFSQLFLV